MTVDRSALEGQVFAAVYTVAECSGKQAGRVSTAIGATSRLKKCSSYEQRNGYCKHDKIERFELRFYDAIGPAKSYVTQKRNGKPIAQTEEQAFVLVGNIADMIKLGSDAQTRYEHEENRVLAHGAAAEQARVEASVPTKPKRKAKR